MVTLSKKRSQEKSYEVRGQSDVCHTSVIFMPAFPWHQMGGKFSHKLVSTLSYLLCTCLCQEISKWFIFFLKFPICSPRTLCEQLQAICLIPLKLWHHVIMLNFEFPNMEIHCSLPLHWQVNEWPPPSLNKWWPPSLNEWQPPSLNEWQPPSLDEQQASSLSRCMAGVLPLSTNSWHPPSLDKQLASSLSWQMAGSLPLLTNSWHPPSLNEQPCPSLGRWAPLPRRMASPPPSANSLLLPSTHSLLLLLIDGLLPPLPHPSLDEWSPPSLDKLSPPSLNELPPPSLTLPWGTVSSLDKHSPPVCQVDWI